MSSPARINKVADPIADRAWTQGYFCAVACLLRESGIVTEEVRSLFAQGGSPVQADAYDIAVFTEHGLM